MLELMEVDAFMTLEDAVTRPDPTSVAAVGTNWVESVCDSIAQKQRARFSAAARYHMMAKRIEKGTRP
jgi:hypothetical protein